jgi:hypothetical protein
MPAFRRLIGLIAFLFSCVAAAAPVVIESFTPEGTIKGVTQVTARFSETMVSFGDPQQIAPFDIRCPVPGVARWVDTRNWVYDFTGKLPAGIRCEFKARSGLRSLAGEALAVSLPEKNYAFSTGGPAIESSRPWEGDSAISDDQVFVLILDAEPDLASIEAAVSFAVDGVGERVGVRFITGPDRDHILRQEYIKEPANRVVLLQAKQKFPESAKVSLVWGAAVKSASGVANEQDHVLNFQVRKPFEAKLSCERENVDAQCIPLTPLTLRFNAQVARADAARIVLRGPGGKTWKGDAGRDDDGFFSYLDFKGPFPENAELTLEIPPTLKDDAGRTLANASQFPLAVHTDAFPPLAKFAARFGIIELKGGAALPMTVRNLEAQVHSRILRVADFPHVTGKKLRIDASGVRDILYWINRVEEADRERSVFATDAKLPTKGKPSAFELPRHLGKKAFEVVGLPLEDPGLYVVELESSNLGQALLGKSAPLYVPTAALVTNLSVHFKRGRESSLIG